jgi:type IV pilus assembly protein PilN
MRAGHAEVRAVILINLLPHREAARKRRREVFYISVAVSAIAGALIAGGVYLGYATRIATQQQRNETLQVAIKKLEAEIKDIATLQQEIAGLKARQQAVEDLQADRNMPVHLLNELARQVPDGIFLTSVRQDGQRVTLGGVAQSNERVSEFLRNLSHNSPWLTQPELIEIVASSMDVSPRDRRRVANFNIRVRILRASEAQKPAAPASTPAKS